MPVLLISEGSDKTLPRRQHPIYYILRQIRTQEKKHLPLKAAGIAEQVFLHNVRIDIELVEAGMSEEPLDRKEVRT